MAADLWYLGAFAEDDKHQNQWSFKREVGVVFKFIIPTSFLITIFPMLKFGICTKMKKQILTCEVNDNTHTSYQLFLPNFYFCEELALSCFCPSCH